MTKSADERHGKRVHLGLTRAGQAVLANNWVSRSTMRWLLDRG